MPCFHPLHGYTKKGGGWTPNFSLSLGSGRRVTIPCGQCIGCRLERSRQWAIRCIHEASMFGNKNVFVTLTYRKECLPEDGSLDYRHFQLFMKKLRKKFVPKCPFASDTEEREAWLREHEIRFYMCGEYGDENGRPHYHAILFNCQFEDKYYWRKTPTGYRQYRSKILDGCFKGTSEVDPEASPLWIYGNAEFADVSFKSCAYVARYIMKKVTGDAAAFHYADVDPETGEVLREVKPEFSNMSRRPGIGHDWLKSFNLMFILMVMLFMMGIRPGPLDIMIICLRQLILRNLIILFWSGVLKCVSVVLICPLNGWPLRSMLLKPI